jgi:RHS repeat-associated protein
VSYADPLSRLTSSVQYGGEPGGRLGTYTYDNYGRIRLKDGRQYYYGDASRPQRPTAIGAESVGTDDNGEMTVLPGGRGLTYDPQGRLVQVTRAGYYATTYAYDASGARVVARDIVRGTTTFFFGTFDLYPDEGRIVRHFRTGGDVIASSPKSITMAAVDRAPPATMLAKRVFGGLLVMSLGLVFGIPGAGVRERRGRPRRSLATLLAALLFIADLGCPSLVAAQCSDPRDGAPPTESIFYHVDRLGGPQLITDAMGGVLERIVNRPYGDVGGTYDSSGVLKTQSDGAFGYTGHRLGDSSGLIYMNARFYDPMSGLFVSMDPARAFMSPYSYVGGDPINAKDPTGMDLVSLLILFVVMVALSAVVSGIVAAANGASASEALKAAGNAAASSAMNGAIGIVGGFALSAVTPALAEAMSAISTGMSAVNTFAAGVGHNWEAFAIGVASLAVGMALGMASRDPESMGESTADPGTQSPGGEKDSASKGGKGSGAPSQKNFDRHDARRTEVADKVTEWANKYNPESVAQNREFSGIAYSIDGGPIEVTEGFEGQQCPSGAKACSGFPYGTIKRYYVPEGAQINALVHSHGAPAGAGNTSFEHFSPKDAWLNDSYASEFPSSEFYGSFLATPNGQVTFLPPYTDTSGSWPYSAEEYVGPAAR